VFIDGQDAFQAISMIRYSPGHYYAYVRHEGDWYLLDGIRNKKVTIEQIYNEVHGTNNELRIVYKMMN
jgi:hypothetical protein